VRIVVRVGSGGRRHAVFPHPDQHQRVPQVQVVRNDAQEQQRRVGHDAPPPAGRQARRQAQDRAVGGEQGAVREQPAFFARRHVGHGIGAAEQAQAARRSGQGNQREQRGEAFDPRHARAQPNQRVSSPHPASKDVEKSRQLTRHRLDLQTTASRPVAIGDRCRQHQRSHRQRPARERPGQGREDEVELDFDREAPEHGVHPAHPIVERVLDEQHVVRDRTEQRRKRVNEAGRRERRRGQRQCVRGHDLPKTAPRELPDRERAASAERPFGVRKEQHEAADHEK